MARALNKYPKGSIVRVWGVARAAPTNPETAEEGALTNPTTKVIKYADPAGNITTDSSPTNTTTGVFYTDITTDQVGRWLYQVNGDGVLKEGAFEVVDSKFA